MKTESAVCCLLGLVLAAGVRASDVSPSDPYLQYIGRWETSDTARPWAQAQGSTVMVRFTGEWIAATLNTVADEYFRVILDGDADASEKVRFPSGGALTLATDLEPGTHTLELVKETDQGRATLLGLEIDEGASTLPPPPRPDRRIVFYGDSNVAGFSLDSERNQGGWDLVGCYYGYAGITARIFGTEYQNISRGGATIANLHEAYDRVDWNTVEPVWDFRTDPADVVVVNIGANDAWRPQTVNKNRYHRLLDDLRLSHPEAHIILFNAFGWDTNEPANYTHEVIAEREDPMMSSAVFPWVFEQFHGCQTDHSGMAQYLAAHLSEVTGWDAGPPDVVSGYGRGGNVANGSFEEAAPFGGWGWRYFDDGGVDRVLDPEGAHHGDHYLRLSDGAASHQTNPADDGDAIGLSMWLRGGVAGDIVDVSISFRDQDGGGEINEPMRETVETMTLSESWQHFTMTATAPNGEPKRVYSVRVSFAAGANDAVDIDGVTMGPEAPVPRAVTGRVEP